MVFIKDIIEPKDYILDEFKPFKSYKYKVTANCAYRKRTLNERQPEAIKKNIRMA